MDLHKSALQAIKEGAIIAGHKLMFLSAMAHDNHESQYFVAITWWDLNADVDGVNDEAMDMFYIAIAGGHVLAMKYLGLLFLSGAGVDKNIDEGLRLLKMAADNGCAAAYYCLGSMFLGPYGFSSDVHSAEKYFEKAFQLGYAIPQNRLEFLNSAAEMSFNELLKNCDPFKAEILADLYEAYSLLGL